MLAAHRDIRNRLCNVLMYFFPEGKMHVADIIKIPYMLATNEGLAKYAVESRRDGKLEEKAGWKIANECRALVVLCDWIIQQSYNSDSMLSTAKYVSARMNVLGNSQAKQGHNVNKRKTIVEGEEGIIERVRFRDFLGSIPVCNMVCGLTDVSEPESVVLYSYLL